MENPVLYDSGSVQISRVSDRVYYRTGDLEHRRQCCGGFILLDGCTAAVDAPTPEGAEEMLRESLALFGRPVKAVFLTHAHRDHDLGLPVFAREGAAFYAAPEVPEALRRQGTAFPADFTPVADRLRLETGGPEIILERVGVQAHSPWDMLVRLPGEGVVFTGDLVAAEPILYLESCSLPGWLAALRRLEGENIPILARGHGGCAGSSCLRAERRYLEALIGVNRYMRGHLDFGGRVPGDAEMGKALEALCRSDFPGARLLQDTSGPAAWCQLAQFYQFDIRV